MRSGIRVFLLSLVIFLSGAPLSLAAEEELGKAGEEQVVVLDTTGFWRLHHTLKPPVVQLDDGLTPVLLKHRWLNSGTPPPPPGWMEPGFDDSSWLRGPARIACKTPYLARLCVRGKFRVTDPARVTDLFLSVGYQGGVIVYVNGREVARAHLPGGSNVQADVAEPYPLEAFVTEQGELMGARNRREPEPDAETLRRLTLRERNLESVAIPRELLCEGVNVLGMEIIRAPYHKVVEEKRDTRKLPSPYYEGAPYYYWYDLCFNTCELSRVQLTSTSAEGLVPNATRPEGLQVWNDDLLASEYDLDFGDPTEPLRPISIVGARNGSFSGKVIVGSDRSIAGLEVTPGGLRGEAGTIPASAVRIRYGLPWGHEWGIWGLAYGLTDNKHWRYPRQPTLLSALAEAPLTEFPVRTKTPGRYDLKTPGQPEPILGAVVPLWVTVTIPAGARPGTYTGRVTIRAEGEEPVEVPLELKVVDWTLPDPQDYQTWVELVQSPDTLAVEYGLDPWSDRHREMVAHSMQFLSEVGSRVLYVPLICHTNYGNEQSMVRWIEKGADQFDFDFSIMDRYLDTAEEHMGRPKIVAFVVWDVYLMQEEKIRTESSHDQEERTFKYLQGRDVRLGSGPVVTLLDPATKKAESIELPLYADPSSKALWAPLFKELRKRMQQRGLEEVMMLGDMSDAWPTKEEAEFFKEVSGDLPWVSHSHMGVANCRLHDVADVGYQSHVAANKWSAVDEDTSSRYGWKRPELAVQYNRTPNLDAYPVARWRHFAEANITGEQRGIGRVGADFWRAVKDKRGRRSGTVSDRYPQSTRRNLNIYTSLLAPGPDGPVATTRFEIFREGVQECEARILIERALTDDELRKELGPDLAKRCQEVLDERSLSMWKGMSTLQLSGPYFTYATAWWYFPVVDGNTWYVGSGWQQRSEELYALAGEVSRKLAHNQQ